VTSLELREEIDIQLELMAATVNEIAALCHDVGSGTPTVREKTAAAAFMAQFYGGVENILKRIHCYNGVALPGGDAWHIETFQRFCLPGHDQLPVLFDEQLMSSLAPYRKFRHVVYHGYGVLLDWGRMAEGLSRIPSVFISFRSAIEKYLATLD